MQFSCNAPGRIGSGELTRVEAPPSIRRLTAPGPSTTFRPARRWSRNDQPGASAVTSPAFGESVKPQEGPVRLFIVGCPRSGTTWMQLLLAQHPRVVTSQETHLFSTYLGPLMREWERERRLPADRRKVGLTTVLGAEDFRAACTAFTDVVFAAVLRGRSDAEVLVEKTPDHVAFAEEILAVYPEAVFLHVIRDPRAVVCSLRSAAASWGAHWAPESVADGARLWRARVEAGCAISRLTDRYHEVRYEELTEDAASVLAQVWESLGFEVEAEFCDRAAEACEMKRLRGGGGEKQAKTPWQLEEEPPGFFRQGRARGWRDELTKAELARIEHVTGPLMETLGYETVTGAARGRRPVRLAIREALEWRFERLHHRGMRWLRRIA